MKKLYRRQYSQIFWPLTDQFWAEKFQIATQEQVGQDTFQCQRSNLNFAVYVFF